MYILDKTECIVSFGGGREMTGQKSVSVLNIYNIWTIVSLLTKEIFITLMQK